MKKILTMIMTICLVLSFAGCGSKGDESKDNTATTTDNGQAIQSDTSLGAEEDNTKEDKVELMYTFKDPEKPVAFDYPNLKSIEEGTSQIFSNSKYLIVYCRDTKQAELNNIVRELSDKFAMATSSYLMGNFDSFSVTASEEKMVNQTKVLLIEGLVVAKYDNGSIVNFPMRGYTFKKGDIICELIGVLNEESNPEAQAEMEATVEAMISTLREDR